MRHFLGCLSFDVDLTTLSKKLKAHRCINGLSQNQLGKILGVDGSTVVAGNWRKIKHLGRYWKS